MAWNGFSHDPTPFGRVMARFGDQFSFEAQVVEVDGAVVVVAVGEIDMATAGLFRQAVDEGCRGDRVQIDLAGTTFIDSSGLAVLVGAHQRLGGRQGAVVLHSVDARIRQVLEISGLDKLVTMVGETRDDPLPQQRIADRDPEGVH